MEFAGVLEFGELAEALDTNDVTGGIETTGPAKSEK